MTLTEAVHQYYQKGLTTAEICERVTAEGYKRPSDGEPLKRKDINNQLTRLKLKGATMKKVNIIEQAMEQLQCTQKELAKRMGVNPCTIAKWKIDNKISDRKIETFKQLTNGAVEIPVATKRNYNRKIQMTEVPPEFNQGSGFVMIFSKDTSILKSLLETIQM